MAFEMYDNYFNLVRAFCVIFWLGLVLEATNYGCGLGFGLVDVALASCTYGLVNISACLSD